MSKLWERIAEFVKKFKLVIFLGGVLILIGGRAYSLWFLPERVKEVESKQDQAEDNVDKMAQTIDKYIEVQQVKEEEMEKRQEQQMKHQQQQNEMMWKVLDRITEE